MAGNFELPREKRKLPTYPAGHRPFTAVPKGGSNCGNCKFGDAATHSCGSPHYKAYFGTKKLPAPPLDEQCSDWWEPKKS